MGKDKLVKCLEEFDSIIIAQNNLINNNVISRLCDKAKQLITNALMGNYLYFKVEEIPEDVFSYTPIEQIYWVAFNIVNKYLEKRFCYSFEIKGQVPFIVFNDVKYIVDFYIDKINSKKELQLKKSLIVECDGFESHSTKEQINHDVKRENDLKIKGNDIIRFTGTHIFENPYHCVFDTILYLFVNNKELLKAVENDNK